MKHYAGVVQKQRSSYTSVEVVARQDTVTSNVSQMIGTYTWTIVLKCKKKETKGMLNKTESESQSRCLMPKMLSNLWIDL